jgi:hypothetical protein
MIANRKENVYDNKRNPSQSEGFLLFYIFDMSSLGNPDLNKTS